MSEEGVAKSAQVAENDNITISVQPHAAFGAYNQAEHGGRERFSSRIAFYFTGEFLLPWLRLCCSLFSSSQQ
jgi:hypothetical protein